VLSFHNSRTIAIGEAMIEMAVVGENTYKRSFAGDTFNTAWHMSQVPGADIPVGFLTRVGTDAVSDSFIADVQADGLDSSVIGRDMQRTMGLYMIELDGVERSFHYWRDQSAARRLAEDRTWLDQSLAGCGLIHLSGITLAILSPQARETLFLAISKARAAGARVSLDPNIRPRLWSSPDETRQVMSKFYALADIALPSFDDEHSLWGDSTPAETVERLQAAGVGEIIVKDGANPATVAAGSMVTQLATPPVARIRDTTGAGDAFNAGYLVARLKGYDPVQAIAPAQTLSAEVIGHFGARIPKEHVPAIPTFTTT
jgi:2-dehydro-3-deoxygluconokinase